MGILRQEIQRHGVHKSSIVSLRDELFIANNFSGTSFYVLICLFDTSDRRYRFIDNQFGVVLISRTDFKDKILAVVSFF